MSAPSKKEKAPANKWVLTGPWAGAWKVFAGIGALGLAGAAAGFATNPERFAFSWLFAFITVLLPALGALFFVLIQRLTSAGWSVTVRRTAELFAAGVLPLAVLFVPVIFTMGHLFPWLGSHGGEHGAAGGHGGGAATEHAAPKHSQLGGVTLIGAAHAQTREEGQSLTQQAQPHATANAARPAAGHKAAILFGNGETTLPKAPDAEKSLKAITDELAKDPTAKVQLSGFVDSTGKPEINKEIAKQRALAVREALKKAGVDESRIVLDKPDDVHAGVGEAARRVELAVVADPAKTGDDGHGSGAGTGGGRGQGTGHGTGGAAGQAGHRDTDNGMGGGHATGGGHGSAGRAVHGDTPDGKGHGGGQGKHAAGHAGGHAGGHALGPMGDPHHLIHAETMEKKSGYLNKNFFLARVAVYFVIWIFLAFRMLGLSVQQDTTKDPELTLKAQRLAPAATFLFALSLTFAVFDWVMSLEPAWFSTIFGVCMFACGVVSSYAILILVTMSLKNSGPLEGAVTKEHYHDLGKLMWGFLIFWAYVNFSQFMLIWYAALPEETTWYHHRWDHGPWAKVSIAIIVGHFVVPFFWLISRNFKRNLGRLQLGAALLLVMHVVDIYWFVMPNFQINNQDAFSFHWMDAACLLAVAGIYGAYVFFRMTKVSLVPVGDPRLQRSLHFQNA